MTVQPSGRRSSASCWFVLAALAGVIHAAVTLYWALGERGLLWTMGDSFVAQFADIMWVLYPVALVKGVSAVAPLWLARRGWPLRRLTRPVCWVGSVVLVAWGGANTVLANAVLLGAVRPDGGFDRAAMIGHAWIWDPLFLVWGASLAAGLWSTRHSEGQPTE
ncbi:MULTISPECIES: DUF3995 domain-containing protein [Dermacoccus]|uniref:DUF3995 domain-containing protein n=1 Tax=Dermacoccus nishinomiyaensis TaxID=1274 RepID=A0A075JNP9_9MICO|nr:DUF3995 domain-containing protein [Dermacoccus nishinomiyaensis]AIF41758.1 hypothetical protein HX89_13460 [Dermacoccus nishinomiyaensis]MCI0154810.1 DUF3995 domain-containing protein [Dermacoccus nishinomiyaensis]NHC32268.1 DUF3995 domain-containing protein [Dermacoccus nishinomiyaensis]